MIKPTDNELKEYLYLEAAVKTMLPRIEAIRAACKEYGSFCTENFVCAVNEQRRTGLCGLSEAEEKVGRLILDEYGLIKTVTFQLVKIAELNRR